MSMQRLLPLLLVTALASTMLRSHAYAQAWVGTGGSLSVSADYSYSPSDKIIEDEGQTLPGDVANHSTSFSVEYAPINALAIQATIPIVSTVYKRQGNEYQAHGRYDDGNLHTVLQDLRLGVRYMILSEPVAIAPQIGVSVPMTDYETLGYAGAGRGLKQLHLAMNVGKYFNSVVPNLYLHGSYEFSMVERYQTEFPETAEYGQNRSDIRLLAGYYVTDDIEVNLAVDWRIAHGGFAFLDWNDVSAAVRYYHDGLLRESYFLVGGGASYQITETLRANAMLRFFVDGTNTRNSNMFGGSITWDLM